MTQAIRISQIKQLLDEIASNPGDVDNAKAAVEIDSLYHEDVEIAENMTDYWRHLNSEAER